MNSGDSLIALSMNLEDNHGGFGFGVGLYSPRVTRSVSNVSTASSDDRLSYESREMLDLHLLETDSSHADPLTVFPPFLAQSPPSTSNVLRNPSTPNRPKDTKTTPPVPEYRVPVVSRERHASTGKENLLNKQLGSPKSSADTSAHSSGRHERYHRSLDVYNFEGFTPKKKDDTGESTPDSVPSTPTGKTPLRATLAFQQGARMQNSSTTGEISFHPNDSLDSQTLEDLDSKADIFEKPAGVLRMQTRESPAGSSSPRVGSLMSPPESFPLGKGLCFSPGYGKFEGGSSTCSSCMSSPIILQSDSQCFTYSVRRYIDCYSGRPDSPVEIEGTVNVVK